MAAEKRKASMAGNLCERQCLEKAEVILAQGTVDDSLTELLLATLSPRVPQTRMNKHALHKSHRPIPTIHKEKEISLDRLISSRTSRTQFEERGNDEGEPQSVEGVMTEEMLKLSQMTKYTPSFPAGVSPRRKRKRSENLRESPRKKTKSSPPKPEVKNRNLEADERAERQKRQQMLLMAQQQMRMQQIAMLRMGMGAQMMNPYGMGYAMNPYIVPQMSSPMAGLGNTQMMQFMHGQNAQQLQHLGGIPAQQPSTHDAPLAQEHHVSDLSAAPLHCPKPQEGSQLSGTTLQRPKPQEVRVKDTQKMLEFQPKVLKDPKPKSDPTPVQIPETKEAAPTADHLSAENEAVEAHFGSVEESDELNDLCLNFFG